MYLTSDLNVHDHNVIIEGNLSIGGTLNALTKGELGLLKGIVKNVQEQLDNIIENGATTDPVFNHVESTNGINMVSGERLSFLNTLTSNVQIRSIR